MDPLSSGVAWLPVSVTHARPRYNFFVSIATTLQELLDFSPLESTKGLSHLSKEVVNIMMPS